MSGVIAGMNLRQYLPVSAPRTYSAESLLAMPVFKSALRDAALNLIAIYEQAPYAVRYVSDMRRWLVTQAAMALHFEHKTGKIQTPLTPSRLLDVISDPALASRNTVASYLAEMRRYKLFVDVETGDGRHSAVIASPQAETLIGAWFESHLRSLDFMDGGRRVEAIHDNPSLLHIAQPLAARMLINDERWNDPPESVGIFTHTSWGSNVLHDLVARFPLEAGIEAHCYVGSLKPNLLTAQYKISRSQAIRILSQAQKLGLIGWEKPSFSGDFWIGGRLVEDYRRWQAVKFAALSQAMAQAIALNGS